jgi:hypothetical protein
MVYFLPERFPTVPACGDFAVASFLSIQWLPVPRSFVRVRYLFHEIRVDVFVASLKEVRPPPPPIPGAFGTRGTGRLAPRRQVFHETAPSPRSWRIHVS